MENLLEKKRGCSSLALKITSITNDRIKAMLSSGNFLNIYASPMSSKSKNQERRAQCSI